MQLKQIRIARKIQQKELATAIGTDEPMISKFENYKCLPTPRMMEALCNTLQVEVSDIYEPQEVHIPYGKTSTKRIRKNCYYLSVRLPLEAREIIAKAMKILGFKDKTVWMMNIYESLKKLVKEKDTTVPGSTSDVKKG